MLLLPRRLASLLVSTLAVAILVLSTVLPASALVSRGALATPGTALAVAIQGTHAYVAAGSAGLRIVDISNPNVPVEVGSAPTPDSAADVAVAGNRAYVAASSAGTRIFDVSNPVAPVEIGSYVPAYNAVFTGVKVVGTVAYLAAQFDGLEIVDVSNPAAPTLLGRFDATNAVDVAVSGSTLYLAGDGGPGFFVIDVSNPRNPVQLADVPVAETSARGRIGVFANQLLYPTGTAFASST